MKYEPGDKWLQHGPCNYIPPVDVEVKLILYCFQVVRSFFNLLSLFKWLFKVVERRNKIALDDFDFFFVRFGAFATTQNLYTKYNNLKIYL